LWEYQERGRYGDIDRRVASVSDRDRRDDRLTQCEELAVDLAEEVGAHSDSLDIDGRVLPQRIDHANRDIEISDADVGVVDWIHLQGAHKQVAYQIRGISFQNGAHLEPCKHIIP